MIESLVFALLVMASIVLTFWVISAFLGLAMLAGITILALPGWILFILVIWFLFGRKKKHRKKHNK